MLWLRMFVGNKWVCLLRYLDVPIVMKSVLLALSLSVLVVIQPEISLRQWPSCLRERSVSVVDKDMYTWVSSAYKRWSNLWLWISELSGVVSRVNSSGPWTDSWGTPQNKGTAFEKHVLAFIETYLLRTCPICYANQRGDPEDQNNQWCQKLQINLKVLVLWPFLCPCLVPYRYKVFGRAVSVEWNCL